MLKNQSPLDHLIDLEIARASVTYGQKFRSDKNMANIPAHLLAGVGISQDVVSFRAPKWSEEDEQFLRDNYLYMTDAELGERLGRTAISVHLHWEREMHMKARSKAPGVMTAEQMALILNIDSHKVTCWFDAGLINGWIVPGGKIRLIKKISFYVWACNPMNWVYFDIHKVQDLHLKKLLLLKEKRWGDEWWRTTKVAEYHGVDVGDVKRYIKIKRLKSFRPPVSLGGRHNDRKWGYHFVLRSEALKVRFYRMGEMGTSISETVNKFTPAADAFLLKARDKWKLKFTEIGYLMKIGRNVDNMNDAVARRYHYLKKDGLWLATKSYVKKPKSQQKKRGPKPGHKKARQ